MRSNLTSSLQDIKLPILQIPPGPRGAKDWRLQGSIPRYKFQGPNHHLRAIQLPSNADTSWARMNAPPGVSVRRQSYKGSCKCREPPKQPQTGGFHVCGSVGDTIQASTDCYVHDHIPTMLQAVHGQRKVRLAAQRNIIHEKLTTHPNPNQNPWT